MAESLVMADEECEAVLRAGVVGRVAVSTPTGPEIVPVNYSVVGDAIMIRTSAYSRLGTHGRGQVLAFEVDGFDHERQRGWSVQARGRAEVVTDLDELAQIRAAWEPRPWAAGQRNLVLRLPWASLSGRQLGGTWSPLAAMPVRRTVSTPLEEADR
jgi:nitroimidazol reductase NimA-like FMN-containing flavoprotein (pyridoxamine 5'-phosphate oxidase superfamily)